MCVGKDAWADTTGREQPCLLATRCFEGWRWCCLQEALSYSSSGDPWAQAVSASLCLEGENFEIQ